MKQNVGKIDRIIRVVAGGVLLSFVVTVEGPDRWFGLIGLPLLVSGLFGYCFAYALGNCASKGCGCGCGSKSCKCGSGEKSEGGCCGSKTDKADAPKAEKSCGCAH